MPAPLPSNTEQTPAIANCFSAFVSSGFRHRQEVCNDDLQAEPPPTRTSSQLLTADRLAELSKPSAAAGPTPKAYAELNRSIKDKDKKGLTAEEPHEARKDDSPAKRRRRSKKTPSTPADRAKKPIATPGSGAKNKKPNKKPATDTGPFDGPKLEAAFKKLPALKLKAAF